MTRRLFAIAALLVCFFASTQVARALTPLQRAEAIQTEVAAEQAALNKTKTAIDELVTSLKSGETEAEKLEREKREREAKERAEREAREKAEREAKEKAEREQKEKEEREHPGATWHGFTASNPMPATQEPFGPESFINQKIPLAPELVANSKGIAEYVGHANPIWSDGGYDRPIYYASETDPVVKVREVKYGAWINGTLLKIPAVAKPAVAPCWPGCNGDHHIGIVEPNGELFDLWAVSKIAIVNGGVGELVAGGAGYSANFGTGSGVSEREDGSTASGFNNMTGAVRSEELAAGHINHALAGPVHETKSGCHVGPAKGSDGTSGNVNAPCQGQLLYLEYTPSEIAAKPWPRWEKTLVTAIAEYGYYVDDSGGGGGFTIKIEAPIDRIAFGLPNPFNEALKGEPGLKEATGAGGKAYILELAGVEWSRLRAIQPISIP